MAKFRFPLQALLDQRESEERRCQLEVATIERERLELEGRIAQSHSQIRSHKEDLRDMLMPREDGQPAAVTDMRPVRLQAVASLSLQARTQRLALQLAGVYQRLDRARAALLEATTKRRAVEHLKDKRYQEWKRVLAKREAAELDDIASGRAARAATRAGGARRGDAMVGMQENGA